MLSASDFIQLAPDGERAIKNPDLRQQVQFRIADKVVARYPKISLLSPTLAGRYKLVATYAYDRAKYVSTCDKNCSSHSKPEAAWNRCLDTPFRIEAEFTIK